MKTPPLHPDVIEFLDDLSLLEAYHQNDSKADGPIADALIAEMKRRNLDI